jgi:transcriptional regulator with XRE-family HTH domain
VVPRVRQDDDIWHCMEKLDDVRLMELGKRLKHYRKLKGYSNYEHLAFDAGISRSQYGKYENGGNIKFTTLCKILIHLDVSLEEFFKEGFSN